MKKERYIYYKVLSKDGKACHGGSGKWHLPVGKKAGKWMRPVRGQIAACSNGYHACEGKYLMSWLGVMICKLEYKDKPQEASEKVVGKQARILKVYKNWNLKNCMLVTLDLAIKALTTKDLDLNGADTNQEKALLLKACRSARGLIKNLGLNKQTGSKLSVIAFGINEFHRSKHVGPYNDREDACKALIGLLQATDLTEAIKELGNLDSSVETSGRWDDQDLELYVLDHWISRRIVAYLDGKAGKRKKKE